MSWLSLGLKALEPIAKEHLTQFADQAIGGLYGNKSGLGLRDEFNQHKQQEEAINAYYEALASMAGLRGGSGQGDVILPSYTAPTPPTTPPAMQNNIDPNMVPPSDSTNQPPWLQYLPMLMAIMSQKPGGIR